MHVFLLHTTPAPSGLNEGSRPPVSLCFQDVKPKKTKNNKKGEVADGKKKGKKEPEEKWKWWVWVLVCP